MTDQTRGETTRVRLPEWIALFGLAITIAGGIWNGGSASSAVQQQTEDNTRRIGVLEVNDQKRGDEITEIKTVATRTETKVDILLGQKGLKP